jgi:hypothetical protein
MIEKRKRINVTILYLVQFTAGIAYPFVRACSNKLYKSSPVTTPAGTISFNDGAIVYIL